jgi:nitrilase
MKMKKFRAAVVQAAPVSGDTGATVEKTIALIREAAARGANIAVFPEAFIGGYPKCANFNIYIGARTLEGRQEFIDYHASAIAVPGPETAKLAEAARETGLYLTIGVIERDGGTLYCTALYFTPDGLAGKHRKLMPTGAERLAGVSVTAQPSTRSTPLGGRWAPSSAGKTICH